MAGKLSRPSLLERSLGIQGPSRKIVAQAFDFFQNISARTGYGTPSLLEDTHYPLVRFTYNYWELIALYEGHWIVRRIVDVPAEDMVRAWPRVVSEIDPSDTARVDRAIRATGTRRQILTAMKWARLFGGAGCLIVIDGHENKLDEPLSLEDIELGAFKGLIPFDRWSGIAPDGPVSTDFSRPADVNLPEFYKVQAQGGQPFKVHSSRVLRFTGPTNPTPEREAYSYWGISVIEPVIEEIRKRDNVSWNIVNLTFRANILAMRFPEIAQLLSGISSNQKSAKMWAQNMSQINQLMSNQSLIPLPENGTIESAQYTFAGLSECYQQFQLDIAGAAGPIPVSRLFGRTITGLGQSNDADERIYEERIATDQDVQLRPQLEKLYPVICMSELGEVPDDLDLNFPSVRVLDEREKVDLAKAVVDAATVALNSGGISPQVYGKELKQSSSMTGIFSNIRDEDIEKLGDAPLNAGEIGGDLFGEDVSQLDPADSPTKALREDARVHKDEAKAQARAAGAVDA